MTHRTDLPVSTATPLRAIAAAAAPALLLLAGAALPTVAQAHPGTLAQHLSGAQGFTAGLVHPFTGLDHLGAMLAVGVWSTGQARRVWVAPLAFALCLLIGALAAAHGLAVPDVEPMIAFSLLAFGLLLANRTPLHAGIAAALIGGFALFHGAAHGVELGAGAALAGMLVATVVLHACGIAIGLALRHRSAWWTRGAGIMLALFGVSLLTA
jgi:urease accessory protein